MSFCSGFVHKHAVRVFRSPKEGPLAAVHVLPLDGKLTMIDPVLGNPKAAALTLEPVSENTFRLEGKAYGALGEQVVFEIGPDGIAVSVMVGENPSERVTYTSSN